MSDRTATSGKTVSLPVGSYRVYLHSYNSNYWESDQSDWIHSTYTADINVVPAHTHEYTAKITTEATCLENGLKTYTCSCGDTYTETIPAHHTEELVRTVAATCTAGGYDLMRCSVCGTRYTANETPALGHDYVYDRTVDPTCEEVGYDVYVCTRCGDSYTENEVPANGHDYHLTRTAAATCVKNGYYIYTCSDCSATYSVMIPALDHFFIDGICVDCGVSEADAPYDVNGDTFVNATDLSLLQRALLRSETADVYDVNKDGYFDVRDLVHLKKRLR